MVITYTDEKKFTKEQTQRLFLSVGWVSGQYPERLHKALMGSSTVFSAWDGERLLVPDADHMESSAVDPKRYWDTVYGFIRRSFKI